MKSTGILMVTVLILLTSSMVLMAQDEEQLTHEELVEYLGVHPDFEDYLHEIEINVSERGEGAPTPERLFVGHVAENRFVIKVEVAGDEYPREETVLHIYADIDNDATTGREGSDHIAGTDMMYSFARGNNDPRFFNHDVRAHDHYPVRGIVIGNTVYVCDDINPNLRDGETHFRLRMLGERREDGEIVASASMNWVHVNVPLSDERTLPPLPMPEAAGFAHITMPNFAELSYSIWNAEGTVRLRPEDADISGYLALMNDDFDGVGHDNESVIWRSPVAGSYHVGMVMSANVQRLQQTRRTILAREEEGEEPPRSPFGVSGLDVLVNGEVVGTVVGHGRSGEEIYYSEEPVTLERGTPIEVRTAEHSSAVVFRDVHLTAAAPAVPPLRIENLAAWHLPDEPGEAPGRIMVAWTTNRPTEAVVGYETAAGRTGELEGRGLVNSHYVMLPPDVPGDVWELEIRCEEAEHEDFEAQQASATYTVHRDRAAHLSAHDMAAAVSGETHSIALSVAEPTDAPRASWPVRSGVPIPEGVLADPSAVRLLDANGAEVPVQTQATSWWPDGLSVRWLLVDFAADTTTGDATRYTLEVNATPDAEPEQAVTVTAEETAPHILLGVVRTPVEVNTGPLTWRLGDGGFAPFADVTINGRQAPTPAEVAGGFELTDEEGVLFTSALEAPEEIIVEQSGPQRATVRVTGRLVNEDRDAYMRYLCRLHFYAGSPAVRTVFTLENDALEPEMNLISSLRLTVPAEVAGAQLSVGADGDALAMAADGRLLQDDDFRFTLGDHEGHRADGWMLAAGENGSLAIAVRDFWQTYPKGFSAADDGVTLELMPELPSDIYADADEDALTQWYFWADEGRYKIRTGVRVSTDFAVDFDPAVTGGTPARYEAADWWNAPLFAACTPEYYCDVGVLDTMLPRHPDRFERYERRLDNGFEGFLARRESEREYGFMNWGDWFGERTWNWGNNEYDTAWSLAVHFLRNGNHDMFEQAVASAAHSADIDTIHHNANPLRVGFQYTHCIGHTAMYFPREWKDMGGFNVHSGNRGGHLWSQGIMAVYALTGEERLLETGRKINDMLAHYTTDFRYGAERSVGWPMVALMGGYDFEANPYYLNGAKLMADIVVWSQHPERGLWGHWIDGNECDHAPRCWGSKPFMTGVLLRGIKMYDLVEPREDVRQTLHDNVAFLFREAYVHEGERPGFVYSGCLNPRYSQTGGIGRFSLIGPGLAYSVLIDPEQRHRDMLEHAATLYFERSGVSSFGKSFTQGTCFSPTTMHDLAELGISEFPAEPLHGQMEFRVPDAPLEVGQSAEGVALLRAPRDRAISGLLRLESPDTLTVEPTTLRLTADAGRLGEAPFRLRAEPLTGFAAYAGALPLTGRFLGTGLDIEARLHVGIKTEPLGDVPLIQAAEFIEEAGGEVHIREDKVGDVGTSISHWDDPGHRLTWVVEAPRDGDYLLVLRYCATTNVERRVQFEGVGSWEQQFADTGGFASFSDDWQHRALLEDDGDPVVLGLRAGEYRVTMTNLCGNGMNLDYVALVPIEAAD